MRILLKILSVALEAVKITENNEKN